MENIKIHYGVSNISDIKEAVEKIDEATKEIDCIGLDVEISIAPQLLFENEEEE